MPLQHPRRLVPALAVLLAMGAFPAMVFAGRQFDTLQKDAAMFDGVLGQEQRETDIEAFEEARDLVTDLLVDMSASGGIAVREEIQADPFVTFRESGVLYTLRDVPRQEWFAPYVRDMVERRIVSGYRDSMGVPTGEFAPARNVAVDELAKMAVVAAGLDAGLCTSAPKNPRAATGSWSRPFVVCAETLGWALFSDGTVDLARPATRAEVIMTILQAFDVQFKQVTGTGAVFVDVGNATQFAPAIHTAALDGIVSGYAEQDGRKPSFGPNNPVNRAEVAKMLSMALQLYYD